MSSKTSLVLFASLLAACSSPQETTARAQAAETPSAKDVLHDLVAKTNALLGFTARYGFTDREGRDVEFTLSYFAPDRAAFAVKCDTDSQRMCVVGRSMHLDCGARQDSFSGTFDLQAIIDDGWRIIERLNEEFPEAAARDPLPAASGICFLWDFNTKPAGEVATFDTGVGIVPNRTHLCGWLETLEHKREVPTETADALLWLIDNCDEVQVSKSTGFVTHQRRKNDPQSKAELVLLDLQLEPPSDEAVFAIPTSLPEGVRDTSAELERLVRTKCMNQARGEVWLKLAKWVDDKVVIWDERARERLIRVLRPWHAAELESRLAAWLKEVRTNIESDAEKSADPEALIASLRASLDDGFDQIMTLRPPVGAAARCSHADEFLTCDRAARAAAYEHLVRGPLLAYCRERIDAVQRR